MFTAGRAQVGTIKQSERYIGLQTKRYRVPKSVPNNRHQYKEPKLVQIEPTLGPRNEIGADNSEISSLPTAKNRYQEWTNH